MVLIVVPKHDKMFGNIAPVIAGNIIGCSVLMTAPEWLGVLETIHYIRAKVAKLARVSSLFTSCRVVAEAPHKHDSQGCQYTVKLDNAVPGTRPKRCHECIIF